MQESIVVLVRVQCRRKESSRSLSPLLMSFLSFFPITVIAAGHFHRIRVVRPIPPEFPQNPLDFPIYTQLYLIRLRLYQTTPV